MLRKKAVAVPVWWPGRPRSAWLGTARTAPHCSHSAVTVHNKDVSYTQHSSEWQVSAHLRHLVQLPERSSAKLSSRCLISAAHVQIISLLSGKLFIAATTDINNRKHNKKTTKTKNNNNKNKSIQWFVVFLSITSFKPRVVIAIN